jgi:hypothetical protein
VILNLKNFSQREFFFNKHAAEYDMQCIQLRFNSMRFPFLLLLLLLQNYDPADCSIAVLPFSFLPRSVIYYRNTDKMSDEEKIPIALIGLAGISLPFIFGLIALYAAQG